MILTKRNVERYLAATKDKVAEWERIFPSLKGKFDEFGRAKLGEVSCPTEDDFSYMVICTDLFKKCFNKYMEEKNYHIRNNNGCYEPEFDPSKIHLGDYVENYYHFSKEFSGKKVKVKVSRVLAAVQEIWLQEVPQYNKIISRIKELRKNGATYDNSDELCRLTEKKKQYEKGNLYFKYQEIMNRQTKGLPVMLSVNPLDLLTSSGGTGSGDNPTSFRTCWSVEMYMCEDGDMFLRPNGEYSNPEAILTVGSIMNRGILFVPNGSKIDINDSLSLYGYRERCHIWFDIDPNHVWMEKIYPNDSHESFRRYTDILNKNGISVLEEVHDEELPFKYQDTEGLKDFYYTSTNIYLDRVAIDDGTLYYLTDYRVNLNYRNGYELPGNFSYCDDCNARCRDSDLYRIDTDYYVCPECYEYYSECDHCNTMTRELDEVVDENGDIIEVCNHCYDWQYDNYCYKCGAATSVIHKTNRGDLICARCAKDYRYCEHCETYTVGDITTVLVNTGGMSVCEECLEYYYKCKDCGEYFSYDLVVDSVDGDSHVCNDCAVNYCVCDLCGCFTEKAYTTEDSYLCNICYSEYKEVV